MADTASQAAEIIVLQLHFENVNYDYKQATENLGKYLKMYQDVDTKGHKSSMFAQALFRLIKQNQASSKTHYFNCHTTGHIYKQYT